MNSAFPRSQTGFGNEGKPGVGPFLRAGVVRVREVDKACGRVCAPAPGKVPFPAEGVRYTTETNFPKPKGTKHFRNKVHFVSPPGRGPVVPANPRAGVAPAPQGRSYPKHPNGLGKSQTKFVSVGQLSAGNELVPRVAGQGYLFPGHRWLGTSRWEPSGVPTSPGPPAMPSPVPGRPGGRAILSPGHDSGVGLSCAQRKMAGVGLSGFQIQIAREDRRPGGIPGGVMEKGGPGDIRRGVCARAAQSNPLSNCIAKTYARG
jgi:hypothetical protein